MPNVASILKQEITRLARKEVKQQTQTLRRGHAQYRKSIAMLNRKLNELRSMLGVVATQSRRAADKPLEVPEGPPVRFSSKGLKSHRERLGLSAEDVAKLIGVSSQTIYNWEHGAVKPGRRHMAKLVEVRKMGKREAQAALGHK